jgi:hypothetical protein
MKVKLTKLESNHKNLRTESIVGEAALIPTAGLCFRVVGKSLTAGLTHRLVTTSEVQSVYEHSNNKYIFHTLNSKYELEVLPNGVPEQDGRFEWSKDQQD